MKDVRLELLPVAEVARIQIPSKGLALNCAGISGVVVYCLDSDISCMAYCSVGRSSLP